MGESHKSTGAIECHGDRAYLTDADGERHRVHDVAFGPPLSRPHHRRIVALGSPQSNHRYFVPEFGVARVYRFTRSESRELTPDRLLQQLSGAGFVTTTSPEIAKLRPT